jgi:hypothetical protein
MSQRLCELSPHFISIRILPFEHQVNNEIIINKCIPYYSCKEKKLLYTVALAGETFTIRSCTTFIGLQLDYYC